VLIPISVTSEIARQENKEGVRCHDHELAMKVHAMSKITLASSAEVWLINHSGESFNQFYNNDMEGLGLSACQEVFATAYEDMKAYCNNVEKQDMEAFPIMRSQRKLHESSSEILTPASERIICGNRHTEEQGVSVIAPVNDNGLIRWTNVPRQPIPPLDNVDMWIGHQVEQERMPVKYQHLPPEGELIASIDGYPEGLLGIPNNDGSPRIIVPKSQRKALVMQCHEDIHH
jgi:hypothetical protein